MGLLVKSIIIKILNKLGYTIHNLDSKFVRSSSSMSMTFERLYRLHFTPQYIIDLGSAKGEWTKKAYEYWPDANYFLFEPLQEQVDASKNNLKGLKNIKVINAVVGAESGQVNFNVTEDLDGSGVYESSTNSVVLPMVKLDDYFDSFSQPILLKFDTHGFEQPILKGAKRTLGKTEAIIMEVYGFDISPTAVRFPQMCVHLEELGFRLWDIVDIMRRPSDQSFWQADAIFLRSEHHVFNNNSYS